MSRYRSYSAYKDSETIWLGEIPTDWNLYDGKRLFSSRREAAREDDEQLAASQKYGVIPQNLMMELNDAKVMLALKGTNSFRHVDGDNFVISLRSFEGGIEHSSYVGCVSPAYTVLRSEKRIAPGYFKYLLKSAPYIAALQASTDSLRDGKSISYEQFGAITLPYPQPEVQSVIASFLDHETAKIDALIEKQQRLIELLKEKRQAVISHAVTKGLNPNAPMKDSGEEWLGEVPAHWEVSQLRYVVREGTSITYGIVQAGPEVEDGVPYIRTSDMSGDALPLTGYPKTSPEIDASYARSKVNAGDLVISIRASVGKCLPVPPELDGANLTQGTAKIAPSTKALAVFMLPFIGSSPVQLYLDSKAKGATFKEITLETLRKAPFLVPPVDEQEEIGRWVGSEDLRFKVLIETAEQAQVLLKERRTALISAAITGKIDVRDWQAVA